MDRLFLISQCLAFSAFLLGVLSFQLKDRTNVLLCWSGSAFGNSLHFLCLGRYTPAVITAIIGARFLLARRSSSRGLFWFFIFASLSGGYLTYEGPVSLLPVIASLIGTTAAFFFSNTGMRIAVGICSLFWIANNILVGSPVATICECIFLTSNIIGLIRLRRRWKRISAHPEKDSSSNT